MEELEKKATETVNETEMGLFDDIDNLALPEKEDVKPETHEKNEKAAEEKEPEKDTLIEEENKADTYNKDGDTTVTAIPLASENVKKEHTKRIRKRAEKKAAKAEQKQENNILKISGTVVNKYEMNGAGPVKLTIAVDPQNGKDADFPVVYVFRDHADNTTIADNILVKDHVKITGHASSYTRRTSDGNSGTFVQEIVADSIEKQEPTYPEQIGDVKGRPHYEMVNAFCFNGEVTQISKLQNNVTILRIRMEQNNYTNTIDVTVFGHEADRVSVGETVTASGRVATQRKEYANGNVRFFQNFIARRVFAKEDKKENNKETNQ